MTGSKRSRWLKLFALLAAMMILAAACGEEEPADTGGGPDSTESPVADFTLANEGHLTVGSDIPYPPFEFEEAGELTGFDVEIVRAIAVKLGLDNEGSDWISFDFGTIFTHLQSPGRRFDIVVAAVTGYAPEGSPASETVAERTSLIDFTDPYYPSLQSLTINTDSSGDIQGVDDLSEGDRVGVQRATTGAFYAEENLAPLGVELVSFNQAPQMYQQLQAGSLVAVFNDLPVSSVYAGDLPVLEVVEQVPTGEEYAIAVPKDNTALTEAINQALGELIEEGTYQEIFQKYFPDQTLPDYAM